MFGLEKETLQFLLETNQKSLNEALKNLAKTRKKLKEWDDKVKLYERELPNKQRAVRHAQEALIIEEGVSQEILILRETILKNKDKAKRKDITIDTKEKICQKITEQKKTLVEKCVHPFVLKLSYSYLGSRLSEYNDSHRGIHLCVVCGYSEKSTSINPSVMRGMYEDTYPTLNSGPNCFVSNDFQARYFNYSDIWAPLEEILLKYFINKTILELCSTVINSPSKNSD